ncbi:hypothetical protein [Arthrobacter bambusae]|uniref:hypothetical protein n=1 Tax=Arthrobacter bambusae TaxID=1338426 RepID=UPI002788A865|nr:hypothetical protein [Arthrobacter bambusae]MDQ0241203.1 hypothetical protein [Arthrobacter bambusae]
MTSDKALDEVREAIHGYGVYAEMGANATMRHFLDRNIIIPKSDLPEVKVIDRNGATHVDCGSSWGTWDVKNIARMRTIALEDVAAWVTAEEWHAKESAKNAARDKRRDELANKLINPDTPTQTHWSYSGTTDLVRRAVDMIMAIEAAK